MFKFGFNKSLSRPHDNDDTGTLKDDRAKAQKMRVAYPNRIPVILLQRPGSRDRLPAMEKCKFLFPSDFQWHQFLLFVRSRMSLKPEEAIFVLVNNTLPAPSSTLKDIDDEKGDKQGFLSCIYAVENTFGSL